MPSHLGLLCPFNALVGVLIHVSHISGLAEHLGNIWSNCELCRHRRRYKFQVFEVVVWHYVVVEDVIEKLVLLKHKSRLSMWFSLFASWNLEICMGGVFHFDKGYFQNLTNTQFGGKCKKQ